MGARSGRVWPGLAQLRKAMNEQSAGASQIVQAVAQMRQSSASTARALLEQAAASEQTAREAEKLTGQVRRVSKAMEEQAVGASEITTAAESLRQQATQAARAMEEQTSGLKHITSAAGNVARQIKLITGANKEHLERGSTIRESLAGARELTESNRTDVSRLELLISGGVPGQTKEGTDRRKGKRPGKLSDTGGSNTST